LRGQSGQRFLEERLQLLVEKPAGIELVEARATERATDQDAAALESGELFEHDADRAPMRRGDLAGIALTVVSQIEQYPFRCLVPMNFFEYAQLSSFEYHIISLIPHLNVTHFFVLRLRRAN